MPTIAHRICPLCEACCGLQLGIDGDRVTSVRGDEADPFSHGFICPKGAAIGELHADPDRLRAPLVRRGGKHVEVTWDEAFAEIERRLVPILEQHGRDAAGVVLTASLLDSVQPVMAVCARASENCSARKQTTPSAAEIPRRAVVWSITRE